MREPSDRVVPPAPPGTPVLDRVGEGVAVGRRRRAWGGWACQAASDARSCQRRRRGLRACSVACEDAQT
jgi:hypothetical protein